MAEKRVATGHQRAIEVEFGRDLQHRCSLVNPKSYCLNGANATQLVACFISAFA